MTDSLAFVKKRQQILTNTPDERKTLILSAAEELARDGYFVEALDLIYSLDDSAATASLTESFLYDSSWEAPASNELSSPKKSLVNGYVQSSVDYNDWTAQDQPLGGRVRAKLEWLPTHPLFERVTSWFQGSDRNAYFDFATKGTAWNRLLKVETEGLAEKKLWQPFGDSLDRVFMLAKIEANTRPLGKPVSLVFPVRAELEQFRFDRFGSLSTRSLWTAPGIEAVSENLRKSLSLSWEIKELSYPDAVSASNIRQGPVAWCEWYGDRFSIEAETRFQTYVYERDTSLYKQRDLETRTGIFVKTWPGLKAGIRMLGESEFGEYKDSVGMLIDSAGLVTLNQILTRYTLKGSTWSVQPQMVWEWASSYTLTLGLAYGQGNFPAITKVDGQFFEIPKYLETPYEDWRPSLGLIIMAKNIFLNLTADYETNTVPTNALYSLGSSQGVGLDATLFWKLRSWLELELTGIFTRHLAGSDLPGRIQDMASFSLGFTSRFP